MAALLIDLDGVIYRGGDLIAGAAGALDWLRTQAIPHLFLTNTSSRPRSAIVAKLAAMNIRVGEEAILTPAVAAVNWLKARDCGPVALFVPAATRRDFAELDLLAAGSDEAPGAVVVGDLGDAWDFVTLNRAFRLLMATGNVPLLALGMTRYWRAADGLRLDTGAFVSALCYASGVEPVVTGKPERTFFDTALSILHADAADTWMIGDDVRSDVGGAQAAGLRGLLVQTGKFRPQDLDGDIRPDAVMPSIADLPGCFRNL